MSRNGRNRRAQRDVRDFDDIYKGYPLIQESNRNGLKIFTCAASLQQCQARIHLKNGVWTIKKDHNHAADNLLEQKDLVMQQIYNACLFRLLSLTSILSMHKLLNGNIIAEMSWSKLRESARNWRKKQKLPILKGSYRRFQSQLNKDKWSSLLNWTRGKVDFQCLHMEENTILAFFDRTITERLSQSTRHLVITVIRSMKFSLLPMDELLVVTGFNRNYAYSTIWILIKKKSREAYDAASRLIKEHFQDVNQVYATYDQILYQSLDEHFLTVKGTFYSYCSIIYDKTVALGINMEREENLKIIRKLMSLAIEKASRIIPGFTACMDMNEAAVNEFRPLLKWFENNWLNRVGPQAMSCHNDFLQMTDVQLSTRRVLHNFITKQNPTVWDLAKFIVNAVDHMYNDFNQVILKKKPSRYIFKENSFKLKVQLKRLFKKTAKNLTPVIEELQQISFLIKPILADMKTNPETIANDLSLIDNNIANKVDLVPNEAFLPRHPHLVLIETNPDGIPQPRRPRQPVDSEENETDESSDEERFSSEDESVRNDDSEPSSEMDIHDGNELILLEEHLIDGLV